MCAQEGCCIVGGGVQLMGGGVGVHLMERGGGCCCLYDFFLFHLSWKESIIDRLFTAVSKLGFGILWV